MESAPIIGYHNHKIRKISKKLAESYNTSIYSDNYEKLLGFNFKLINEVKNCKASYNESERILEIHWSKKTSFIIPSGYCNENVLSKYFNIPRLNILKENNINEALTFKGAGKGVKDFVRSLKDVKSLIKNKIDISEEDISTLNELADAIGQNLDNNIGDQCGSTIKRALIENIKGWLKNKDRKNIQEIYDLVFDSVINTNFVNELVDKMDETIQKNINKYTGEIEGRISNKELIKMISEVYSPENLKKAEDILSGKEERKNVDQEVENINVPNEPKFESFYFSNSQLKQINEILSFLEKESINEESKNDKASADLKQAERVIDSVLQKESMWSKAVAVKEYTGTFLNMIKKLIRVVFYGFSAIDVVCNSVGAWFAHIVGTIFTILVKSIAWITGVKAPEVSSIDALKQMTFDKGIAFNAKAFAKSIASLAKELYIAIHNGLEVSLLALNKLVVTATASAANAIESLPYIRVCKYIAGVILTYFFIKYTYKFLKDLKYFSFLGTMDLEKAAFKFSIKELTNNYGFDKVLVSTIVTSIIKSDIDKFVEKVESGNISLSPEVLKRLKSISGQIEKTGMKRTKSGVKMVKKYSRSITYQSVKDLLSDIF